MAASRSLSMDFIGRWLRPKVSTLKCKVSIAWRSSFLVRVGFGETARKWHKTGNVQLGPKRKAGPIVRMLVSGLGELGLITFSATDFLCDLRHVI